MKRIFVFIILVMMICSSTGCSAGGDEFADIDAGTLPSKLDLRDYNGKNYVTPVNSQKHGDCWAHSLAGCAEISYLYANDLGVPAGEPNQNVNFSEKYIVWYLYHGITKDDVSVGRVRASQIGEGYDPSEAEAKDKKAVYNIGGEFVHSADLFGSGFGPVDESVEINGKRPYAYEGTSAEDWILPLNAEYRNAPAKACLRNSRVLPSPAGVDENGGYVFNEEGLLAIKAELCQGRGVAIAIDTRVGGINAEHVARYFSGDTSEDHAVTVVGYDDDFPKEYFAQNDPDGGVREGSIPEENGALIIKNSWGYSKDKEDGIDGYFYLSYYDHSISSPLSYEFDSSESAKHDAVNYDQYDLLMTRWYGSADYDGETKMANIFDAEEDENLFGISYSTAQPRTEVRYEIYQDVEDGDPSSGKLLEKGVDRHRYPGAHRVDLKSEYPLKKGEKYAVVLTMKHMSEDGGSMKYTEVFPYATKFSEGLKVRGIINRGESYRYADGKWTDMTDLEDSLIERAYQQCVDEIGSKETYTIIALDSKDTFTVDNYPIKALLAPESK